MLDVLILGINVREMRKMYISAECYLSKLPTLCVTMFLLMLSKNKDKLGIIIGNIKYKEYKEENTL